MRIHRLTAFFSFSNCLLPTAYCLLLRTVSLRMMQMDIGFGGHLNAAQAVAGRFAAIGDDPLQAEQFVELSHIRIKGDEVEARIEGFAAGLFRQTIERALPVVG